MFDLRRLYEELRLRKLKQKSLNLKNADVKIKKITRKTDETWKIAGKL